MTRTHLQALLFLPLVFCASKTWAYDGGSTVKPGAYPTVRILSPTVNGPGLSGIKLGLCGGVMIDDRLLLTAAHCASPPWSGPLSVLVLSDDLTGDTITAQVNAVYLHPDKMKEIAAGWKDSESVTCDTPDLAIVELTVPTKFKVVPIDTRPILQINERLEADGFGSETPAQESSGDFFSLLSNTLKVAQRPIASFTGDCFRLGNYDTDGTGESTTLKGDSGSPVYVRYTDGTLGVVGVVSSDWSFLIFQNFNYFARLDDGAPTSVPMSKWIKSVIDRTAAPAYIGGETD